MIAVFDTNILIDYLSGVEEAATELERYSSPLISRITWIEVLIGARREDEEQAIRAFLARFDLWELDANVCERAIELRRQFRMRLPDAIILATAQVRGSILVTRNTRDFRTEWPEIRVPYQL